jgi:hypothetical protein
MEGAILSVSRGSPLVSDKGRPTKCVPESAFQKVCPRKCVSESVFQKVRSRRPVDPLPDSSDARSAGTRYVDAVTAEWYRRGLLAYGAAGSGIKVRARGRRMFLCDTINSRMRG